MIRIAEVEIDTDVGKFTLRKPKAGAILDGLESAETTEGVSKTKLLRTLLPKCVVKHPFGLIKQPLKEKLEDMEIEQYQKLIQSLEKIMPKVIGDDTQKK